MALHRVRQFFSHLTASVSPADDTRAVAMLPAAAGDLYRSMPVADRRHALEVADRLQQAGWTDGDLLAAALLHDAAKGRRLGLWYRVAVVLLDALPGDGVARLASANPRSWRYPFHLQLQHVERSAAAAELAGCSARTGDFIRGTGTDIDRAALAALQAADAAS